MDSIKPTTVITSDKVNRRLGADVTIVSETFQQTGSFKFRAAYNLAANVAQSHIIAASSGNFGQALACACRLLGKRCTVVMPDTSARVKIEAVRGYDGLVDLIDTRQISRADRVDQLARQNPDAYIASAYDDPYVIEGNAGLGREIASLPNIAAAAAVIAPVGGGGLISGVITGLRSASMPTPMIGAEPLLANDAARSLRAGAIVANEGEPQTLADGARTLSLGNLNWEIIRTGVEAILEVSEAQIAEGVRLLFELANLKVEPTGALAVAALLDRTDFQGKAVCCIVSGGNVDPQIYSRILAGG